MSVLSRLAFLPGISFADGGDGEAGLRTPRGVIPVRQAGAGLQAAYAALSAGGATEDDLVRIVTERDGAAKLAELYYFLNRLYQLGFLGRTVFADDRPVAAIIPLGPGASFEARRVAAGSAYALSRFAATRREGDCLVVESPLDPTRVCLYDWRGGALLSELSRPVSDRDLSARIPHLPADLARALLELLLTGRAIDPIDESGRLPEENDPDLRLWEFHDLFFHTRGRVGRHGRPSGGTYRFGNDIEPLPAVKPPMSDDLVVLERPDLAALAETDRPFSRVLEDRESIREYGDRPLTIRQLGEFLFRVARVRRLVRSEHGELSFRPYPNGGASYEFELYPVVAACEGLTAGLYHYNPREHQLERLSGWNPSLVALAREAVAATTAALTPQVLICIAARFPRVTWKYESIAYAVILKNLGALYQTMYLVATALELAPCAVGAGNSDLFAATAGTNYFAETSVGEFLLGSRPDMMGARGTPAKSTRRTPCESPCPPPAPRRRDHPKNVSDHGHLPGSRTLSEGDLP